MSGLKALMLIPWFTSGVLFLILSIEAYSKRKDRGPLGGSNALNGWWVIFPYGKNGLDREDKELVFWGRVTAIIFYTNCALLVAL